MGLLDKHILKKLLNYDRNKYLNNIKIKYIFWSEFNKLIKNDRR
jgi:hypothetical protein